MGGVGLGAVCGFFGCSWAVFEVFGLVLGVPEMGQVGLG